MHEQVVRAARVAGGLEPELARRVRAEHVAVQHARRDELAVARRDAFVIERRAAERLAADVAAPRSRTTPETPARPPRRAGTTRVDTGCRRGSRRGNWPIRPRATSGLNSTGAFVVASLRAPSRANRALARLAADRSRPARARASRARCCTSSRAPSRRRRRRARRNSRCAACPGSRRGTRASCRTRACRDACRPTRPRSS